MRAFVGMPDGSEWIVEEADSGGGADPAPAAPRARSRSCERCRHDRLPGGRRPGRPGPDDGARARADRHRRRDPVRPADPAGRAGRRPVDAELVYVGKIGGGPQMPQDGDRPAARPVRHRGSDRRAAQGRRPVRVRARRRGGARCCARRASRSRSCRASRPGSRRPPTRASRSRTASYASGVAFVTGHEDGDAWTGRRWRAFPGTLVFYMGVKALPRIASQLVAGGRSPDEPVAVVERGTLPGQKTVVSSLSRVVEDAAGHPRAGDHAGRAGRRAAGARSPGSSSGRCSGAPSPSPAPGRRRRALAERLRGLGAATSRRRRSARSRSSSRSRPSATTTCCASPRPTGAD